MARDNKPRTEKRPEPAAKEEPPTSRPEGPQNVAESRKREEHGYYSAVEKAGLRYFETPQIEKDGPHVD